MLDTEPERLLPLLSTESAKSLPFIASFLMPYLEREARAGRLRDGVDIERAADYLARGHPLADRLTRPLGPRRRRPGPRARRDELLGGIDRLNARPSTALFARRLRDADVHCDTLTMRQLSPYCLM